MSLEQASLTDNCPSGWTRDLWFAFPETTVANSPCNLIILAFDAFAIIFASIFGVIIFLCALAALFNPKPVARAHLVLNSFHSVAGFCVCIGPLVRLDVFSLGTPAFWACIAFWIGGVLAHSLLMTESIKRLSISIAPSQITNNPHLVEQLLESGVAQRMALIFAGIQVTALFVSFILVGVTSGPPAPPFVAWSADPLFLTRREFWFFLACMLGMSACLTFIVIPLHLHFKMYTYVHDTRLKAEQMVASPDFRVSPHISTHSKSPISVSGGGGGGGGGGPRDSLPDVPEVFPGSEEREGQSSKDEEDSDGSKSPRARRPSRIESGLKQIGDSISILSKASEDAIDKLSERLKDALPPPKRRPTAMEVQRKQMLEFENKMLQAFIVGIIGCVASVVLWVLVCDSRLVGPRAFLVFPMLFLTWFLEFMIINIYFPEGRLHRLFVKRLPNWLRDQIDGVDAEAGPAHL